MSNTKANLWLSLKKTKDITFSYEIKQKTRFIKGSLIAVILGLVIGGIIIAAQGVNPFIYLKYLFNIGFSGLYTDSTIQWFCIYIIAALAVGIGFKSGMFNIGVSGQMLMGAGVSIIFFKLVVKSAANMNGGYVVVMFLICAFCGAFMAGIAGLLKALFNIHEVVTTIMLNWAAWYFLKYLFTTFQKIAGSGISSSGEIPGHALTIHGSTIAIPIIFAALAVIAIAVLLAKTTFGFKLRAVGASPSASKYAGYNVKAKMVDAMLISGLLAGIASFINIFTITPTITFNVDQLPQIGYDSIAITLVAFNNPIGTIFSSFLWGILQSAGSSTASMFNLPTQTAQLIFGVTVYFAAISVVFINWYPIIKLRILIALTRSKADQVKIKNLRKQQLEYHKQLLNINRAKDVQDYKNFIREQIAEQEKLFDKSSNNKKDVADINQAIKDYKRDLNLFVKEYRKNLKEMIRKCAEEIKVIKQDNYVTRINSAKEGINKREWDAIRVIEQDALSKTNLLRSRVLNKRDDYKKQLKYKKDWLKIQIKELKKSYKLKLNQNKVWLESETGIANHYWDMFNGTIAAKGEISKIKINSHNDILGAKSDAEMEKVDLKSKFKGKEDILKTKLEKVQEQLEKTIAKIEANEKEAILKQREIIVNLKADYVTTKKALIEEGTTLNKLETAYIKKNTASMKEYYSEYEKVLEQYKDMVTWIDREESESNYKVVREAWAEFNDKVKDLGHDNDLEMLSAKQRLLSELLTKIRSVWPTTFSDRDNNKWSKARYRTYVAIDNEKAKLEKIKIVYIANQKINAIKNKSKTIRAMYNESIKGFREQYLTNKKVNQIVAQQNYHQQIEAFIKNLENSEFDENGQLKEVK